MDNQSIISTVYRWFIAASLGIILLISDNNHSFAQSSTLDTLFLELQDAPAEEIPRIEERIWTEWRKSGSRSVDLLLKRGRDAMASGRNQLAIEHFTAAIDHAPEFAEAWNMRATAFFIVEEYGLSVNDIQQVLVLNPRHFGAMSGLGMILELTNRKSSALGVYEQVLKIHPKQVQAQKAVSRLTDELEGESL